MSKLSSYIRRKLSVKISLWVVLFAAAIFSASMGFFVIQAREAVHQEAISRANQILDNTSLQVESILNRVEVASQMTEWLVHRHPDNPDSMFVYSRGMLLNNPDFYNCSIAFEPYYFKDKGRYLSAYSKLGADGIRTIQGGSDNYQYFYMDWYLMAKLMDRPAWTEPYMDFDAPTNTYTTVTSYCRPIRDEDGRFIGAINTSLSLNWLSETISKIKPYPNSYSVLIGRGGTYLVHPDASKISRQTIFTQTIEHPDTAVTALGHAMQRGEEGMKRIRMEGKKCYVFYKPLGQTGCSMAIVCPESDIFSGFDRLRRIVYAINAIGLLLMLFLFIRVITRELSPLERLAGEAETIASGQFDAKIPDYRRTDEIGQLSHSFAGMQHSLVRYIEELKTTTAQKASFESELNIARAIQMSMLPKAFPPFPDCQEISIYGQLTPAKAVGGDLYDFYIREGKLFFCIGDVSGKGIPASLVMAVTRALFRNVSAHIDEPDHIVSQINNTIAQDNEMSMFVTLFVGVVDLETGHMRYCNAGHDAPLLISRDGRRIGLLPVDSNLPAGVMPGWTFSMQDTTVDCGTTIFLYTDGLNEAENIDHGQFGDQRIIQTAKAACADGRPSPRALVETMVDAVHAFVAEAEQSDDLTMMAIQYNPKAAEQRRHSVIISDGVLEKIQAFLEVVAEDAGFTLPAELPQVLSGFTSGRMNIVATVADNELSLVVSDSGKSQERSMEGLEHLRQIMDWVNYEYKDGKNVLTLKKKLA